MKLIEPVNNNYCATIAKVDNIVPLPKCDRIVGATICENQVAVSVGAFSIGSIGVFFPIETKLSAQFVSNNNMYRHPELNVDQTKKGYIEDNGRLKCVRFGGNPSEGLFMPLESLSFTGVDISQLKLGDEFDQLNGIPICEKYTVINQNKESNPNSKTKDQVKRVSRMVENQFRLHIDTSQLKKNVHRIEPTTLISISSKWHGTSAVIGNVLVKNKLSLKDRIAKYFGCNVNEHTYGNVHASRNVIKNEHFEIKNKYTKNITPDVYQQWADKLYPMLPKGMTLYGEIVGQLESGKSIQKGYNYGCEDNLNDFRCYRITFTNVDGSVFELTRNQIDEICNRIGIKSTPLYYFGYAKDIYPDLVVDENWHSNLIKRLDTDERFDMNNINCKYCTLKVPAEGCVVRIESIYNAEPFKLKNYKFLEFESKSLDAGEVDME